MPAKKKTPPPPATTEKVEEIAEIVEPPRPAGHYWTGEDGTDWFHAPGRWNEDCPECNPHE